MQQRISELGVRKAFGATRGVLIRQILNENLVLTLIGGVVGLVFSYLAVRSVLELAGIKNIRAKSLGSNNKTNVVLAVINGLTQLKTPEEYARLRGKSVEEILG